MADIYGTSAYIDVALKSEDRMVAFDLAGPAPCTPPVFDLNKLAGET